jgi:GNAT superfamily N-acetyltransferase
MHLHNIEYHRNNFTISTASELLDIQVIQEFLANESYWAQGIPRSVVEKCIENSLCFGVYDQEGKQVGFARVVTDCATYAYIADVFILEAHRGHGLSKWLMECIMDYPDLQGLRRWNLATRDAHELYARYGFTPLRFPERWMEILNPDVYLRG